MKSHIALILTTSIVLLFAVPADAKRKDRQYMSHGTANCQAADATYDKLLKRRPMAFANVGTESAFVTCDFDTLNDEVYQADSVHGFSYINVVFQSDRYDAAEAKCTLVSGILGVPRFVSTKSVVMPGGSYSGGVVVTWTGVDDYEGLRFQHPALSCLLPAGIRISYLRFAYSEEVGF